MSKPRRSYSSRKRLLASVKVAALLAALGFVTVVLEQPRLTASPTSPRTSTEQLYPTDAGSAPMTRSMSEPAASGKSQLQALDHLPAYFPGPADVLIAGAKSSAFDRVRGPPHSELGT